MAESKDNSKATDHRSGHVDSADELFGRAYRELRQIAKSHRYRWSGNDTMNTTAIIHEAYLKLADQDECSWRSRGHFFATASKAMRHLLVNYAEKNSAAKRGGSDRPESLDDTMAVEQDTVLELLGIEQALSRLAMESQRACNVFECRVFAGLSLEETAEALDISPSTVKRDWTYASSFVYRELISAAQD